MVHHIIPSKSKITRQSLRKKKKTACRQSRIAVCSSFGSRKNSFKLSGNMCSNDRWLYYWEQRPCILPGIHFLSACHPCLRYAIQGRKLHSALGRERLLPAVCHRDCVVLDYFLQIRYRHNTLKKGNNRHRPRRRR